MPPTTKLTLIDSPTERTTAATDAIIALVAIGCAADLWRRRSPGAWKAQLWAATFGLLALSGALGAAAHGFQMTPATNRKLWRPLFLALGLTVALFVVGAIYDRWGANAARRALPPMLALGTGFFGLTQLKQGGFLVFVVYEAVAMLAALGIYGQLAARRQPGAELMSAGIVVSIIAAAVQASGKGGFKLIWEFDHNGSFHLIQLVGCVLLLGGLRRALAEPR